MAELSQVRKCQYVETNCADNQSWSVAELSRVKECQIVEKKYVCPAKTEPKSVVKRGQLRE